MRGLHWRMLREDQFFAAPIPLTGLARQVRVEGVPLRIDNRDAVVVAFALHTRAKLSNATVKNIIIPARAAQQLMHGVIQLPGRNSVGLVPTALPADAIGLLNAGHGLGNTVMWGGPGGLTDEITVPQEGEIDVESTLILPYAPRALSAQRDADAGAWDGAIDASLFDLAPPTLHVGGLGSNAAGDPDAVVEEIQMELWVCVGTCEPGEALAPTRPQLVLLGDVINSPQHYGIGAVSDVQILALLSVDPIGGDDLEIWASAAQAAIEIDGTEITESPWRALLRQTLQEGMGGFAWQFIYELDTALVLTPASLPKASERHKGSRISIEGYPTGVGEGRTPAYAVAYLNQAPEPEVLATWAAARNVDLSTARVHGKTIAMTGLDDHRFVGISPIYSRRGR